jgi:hypothetical protein
MATATTSELRGHTDDWVERAGKLGLSSRGVVYCVMGFLVVAMARGERAEETDQRGALAEIAERPLGEVLLAVLVVGFVAYALWRLARAIHGEGGKEPNAGQRLLDLAKVGIYLALAYSGFRLLTGDSGGSGSGGQDQAQTMTARLMTEQSWGRWAVGLAGVGVAAYGAWQIYRGVSQKFRKRLDETFGPEQQATVKLGVVGHVGRGAVIIVIGWLVLRAALDFDPNQPVGVDAAIREVLQAPYGTALAIAMAIGLAAYGLYSFGEARFRQIT